MMKNNFIAGSANITEMDEEAKKFPIVSKTETGATLNTVCLIVLVLVELMLL